MQYHRNIPLIQQGIHHDKVKKGYRLFFLFHCPFQISFCLSNAMLTGYATPYLFNGTQEPEYSNFDECYGEEKVGIIDRNHIGFLIWDKSEAKTSKHGLGSRFKTPHLPIWVTSVNNQWGVLFNPRLDLMKSHRETFKPTKK